MLALARCSSLSGILLLVACSGAGASRDAAPGDGGGEGETALADLRPDRDPLACNGAGVLCDRRYDEVAYATTHNAFASKEAFFFPPNQTFGLKRQLDDGVRALMLDVHPAPPPADGGVATGDAGAADGAAGSAAEPLLCHSLCSLGSMRLRQGLTTIAEFLAREPREVVTIVFESYVEASAVQGVLAATGLLSQLHVQPVGLPWPTLAEMIAAGRRLVIFTDRQGGAFAGYHDVWKHAWETPFHAEKPEELVCTPNRGDPQNPLFILNHFLTAPVAMPLSAEKVNHDPFFIDRALRCQKESGALPNFVTVDFYELGDLFAVVRRLNGLP